MKDLSEFYRNDIIDMKNQSLREGIYPDEWKISAVTPIPKVKGTRNVTEFRAVNSIKIIDKIAQKFVKKQLELHVDLNIILTEYQSAFRESAFNLILNKWKMGLEKGNNIVVVFLDLQRAFETVCREKLIFKLEKYGVNGTVKNWFHSWINDRKQYTVFEGVQSEMKAIDFGVPQGTPLSCVLFLLYINEITKCVQKCEICLFADDAVMWIIGKDVIELIMTVNQEFQTISQFLKMNKLKLDHNKTKYMLLTNNGNNCDGSINIDGENIEKVDVIKYLGVMVDCKLKFRENTD